jgi:serine protease Do
VPASHLAALTARLARRSSLAVVGAALAGAVALPAQETGAATPGVFNRYGDRVARIQVTDLSSGAKMVVGSGFFIDNQGHLLTNYHVVADLVQEPERYRATLGDGQTPGDTAAIAGIDVVHDLAILQVPAQPRPHFSLAPITVRQGERLYAFGYPRDLGLSIVEGTYNGLLQHTLYPKLHFTGSLNHGMSGGPAITTDGRVVGVNVSTAGNQLSFLVPVADAIALADRVTARGYRLPPLLEEVTRQIRAYQDVYLAGLFTGPAKTVDLGPFRVPTQPAPFFRCWGAVPPARDLPYDDAVHRCSTDDEMYIGRDQESGVVEMTHELISDRSLGTVRFFALYTGIFRRDNSPSGEENRVTSWRCGTRNLNNGVLFLRTVLCLRAYRKFAGLYDGVVKVAVLGRRRDGLVSTLTVSGASFENIQAVAERFLRGITWR